MELKVLVFGAIISFVWLVNVVSGATILAMLHSQSVSHFRTFKPLLEQIVKRGDDLTLIAHHPLDAEIQSSYTLINLKKNINIDRVAMIHDALKHSHLENLFYCYEFSYKFSEEILNIPEVQAIIHSDTNYDVVLAELFCADVFIALGHKLKAPIVSLTTQSLLSSHNWIIGNPFPSSYVPNPFSPFTEKMSLISRIINTGFNLISILHYEFVTLPKFQKLLEKYFHYDEGNNPDIKDILRNISLHLVNAHHSFEYPKPDQPGVINVGGLHLTPSQTLPNDIQRFMDQAEQGVIYLSFGSVVTPTALPQLGETVIGILKNLPQRVIMKWDKKLFSHVPDNILIAEWFPQSSILDHPNCRLFVTHGGLLSLMESLNATVPVLGIPFFGDQHHNMAMVEYFGIGETVPWRNLVSGTGDEFAAKIDEILNNPRYKTNMQKRSEIFRDRLLNPLDTALYWIDHVIKYKDISHLKSAASQLSWFKLYSLDVVIIAAVFLSLITYILIYVTCKTKILLIGLIKKKDNIIPGLTRVKKKTKAN